MEAWIDAAPSCPPVSGVLGLGAGRRQARQQGLCEQRERATARGQASARACRL